MRRIDIALVVVDAVVPKEVVRHRRVAAHAARGRASLSYEDVVEHNGIRTTDHAVVPSGERVVDDVEVRRVGPELREERAPAIAGRAHLDRAGGTVVDQRRLVALEHQRAGRHRRARRPARAGPARARGGAAVAGSVAGEAARVEGDVDAARAAGVDAAPARPRGAAVRVQVDPGAATAERYDDEQTGDHKPGVAKHFEPSLRRCSGRCEPSYWRCRCSLPSRLRSR